MAQTDLLDFLEDIVKDGVSLLALHVPTKLVVGVAFNNIQVKNFYTLMLIILSKKYIFFFIKEIGSY